jgi:glycosyltransferase involved in cell wall biosynthesis
MNKKIKVLYDHQIFHYQHFGGVSRYFYELFRQFKNSNDVEAIVPFRFTKNQHLLSIKDEYDFIESKFLGNIKFPGKNRLWALRNKYFTTYDNSVQNAEHVVQYLKSGAFDIFHPTYFYDYFKEYIGQKPIIITVYDFIYERYPESFPPAEVEAIVKNKKNMIRRADHVIAISHSVKKDLLNYYSIDEKKISVVYLGNSLNGAGSKGSDQIPEKYILFVGNRSGYKNFSFFIQSVCRLLLESDLHVVCTGKKFDHEELELMRKLKIDNKVHHCYPSDKELLLLYKNAKVFVYPSLYEGFGIPVLESMANGCPAVLSNTSSLPEIGGEAALYFDPINSESLVSAISKCLNDDKLCSEMRKKGFEQAKLFSWEKTASETADIYRNTLGKT